MSLAPSTRPGRTSPPGALVPAALLLLALIAAAAGIAATPGARAAPQAPARFLISGGGFGHGVGMSQHGALGMALRGQTDREIISFYYGGAQVAGVSPPSGIRVGMLQARQDGVVVRATPVPRTTSTGVIFRARGRGGNVVQRVLPHGTTFTLRPEAGGVSVYEGDTRRFGPSAPAWTVNIDFERGAGASPSLLHLPQADQTLRWGTLEVAHVHDRRQPRLRAVAEMRWRHYLRGIAEIPASWPAHTQRAQAIAARSYALAIVEAVGQRRGQADWAGCDCAVLPDTRDQVYGGYERERAPGADAWIAAANATDGQVVRHGGQVVKTLYHSSSGGHTAASPDVFGGASQPFYPARPDPDDAADGRNPNFRWTEERDGAAVTQALVSLGVGEITSIEVTDTDVSGRVREALVRGTRGSERVPGTHLRTALNLKSTKFTITTA